MTRQHHRPTGRLIRDGSADNRDPSVSAPLVFQSLDLSVRSAVPDFVIPASTMFSRQHHGREWPKSARNQWFCPQSLPALPGNRRWRLSRFTICNYGKESHVHRPFLAVKKHLNLKTFSSIRIYCWLQLPTIDSTIANCMDNWVQYRDQRRYPQPGNSRQQQQRGAIVPHGPWSKSLSAQQSSYPWCTDYNPIAFQHKDLAFLVHLESTTGSVMFCGHDKYVIWGWLAAMIMLLLFQKIPLLLVVSFFTLGHSYPLVIQVDDSSKRCFRFNVPEDDE